MKNKSLLNSLTQFEQKEICNLMEEFAYNENMDGGYEEGDTFFGDVTLFNNEVSFIVIQNNYEADDLYSFEITSVEIFDIEKLLNDHNISFAKSNITESVYFTLNKKEYRVSTHKRPAVETSGVYHNHNYENEFICDNEIDMYDVVKRLIKREELKWNLEIEKSI